VTPTPPPPAPAPPRPTWRENLTAVGTFLTGITVAVALAALLFAHNADRETNDLAEQGQITDRFTKAIDQLGHEEGDGQIAIRLGGVYALERIMLDSDDDERNVVEVLSAFVREHSQTFSEAHPELATDIQAALTVLGRRPNFDKPGFGSDAKFGIVDLQTVVLRQAELRDAHLEGAHFEGTHLDKAHLEGAHLAGAHLDGTVLSGAKVPGADLTGAILDGAYLYDVDLRTTRGLKPDSLRFACTDETTKVPAGVTLPTGKPASC
jgi:hypothetical protein